MDITKTLKILILKRDMKQLDVAIKYGMSKNTFNNLLQRNNYKLNDILKIADILDYDVNIQFIDRKSMEVIDVESDLSTSNSSQNTESHNDEGKSLNAYVVETVDKQPTSNGNPSILNTTTKEGE